MDRQLSRVKEFASGKKWIEKAFVIKKCQKWKFSRKKIPLLIHNIFLFQPFPFNVNIAEKNFVAPAQLTDWHFSIAALCATEQTLIVHHSPSFFIPNSYFSAQFQFSFSPGLKSHLLITIHTNQKAFYFFLVQFCLLWIK